MGPRMLDGPRICDLETWQGDFQTPKEIALVGSKEGSMVLDCLGRLRWTPKVDCLDGPIIPKN